jgi:uncharacterized protein YhaN
MKIRGIDIENFRKFRKPIRIGGFSDGVNLLCEANEFGKSTILAAIRGLIFEKHRSKADPIRRMLTAGSSTAPTIAMDFEIDGGLYRIEKRFWHSPYARLSLPDGSKFESDAAEDKLANILGFTEPKKGGSDRATMEMWGVLWVEQRESVEHPHLLENARGTIQSCLEDEVGTLAGGARGQTIIVRAKDDLSRLRDGNGRPRDRYAQVIEGLQQLPERIAHLRALRIQLIDDVDALRGVERDIVTAQSVNPEQENADIEEAKRRRAEALRFADGLRDADHRVELANGALIHAKAAVQVRHGLATRAVDASLDILKLDQILADAFTHEREEAAAEGILATEVAALEKGLPELERTVHHASALRACAVAKARLTLFEGVLKHLQMLQSKTDQLTGKSLALKVTGAGLAALRKAEALLASAQSALNAQATAVELEFDQGHERDVQLNGERLKTPIQFLSIVDDAIIEIKGVGRIAIRPAVRDRAVLVDKLHRAEKAFTTLLAEFDCVDMATAETRLSQRTELEAQASLAQREMVQTGKSLNEKIGVPAELASLIEREAAQLLANLESLGVALERLPDVASAESYLELQKRQLNDQTTAVFSKRSDAAGPRARLDAAKTKVAEVRHALDVARTKENQHKLALEMAERETSEAVLISRLAAAELEVTTAVESAQRHRQQSSGDTVDGMEARLDRLNRKREERLTNLSSLRTRQAALRAAISAREGEGVDEELALAEREKELLSIENVQLEQEIGVLELLLCVILDEERKARERYMKPVVRRIEPYLRQLFPGAGIQVDDDFRITGITRGELSVTEDFGRLSDGTQEQIAILTRLAFADMLIDRGKPAMVVLDDGLVYSDPERMARMFDIITHAARKTQMLIMSCRSELFQDLGGTRLRVEERTA